MTAVAVAVAIAAIADILLRLLPFARILFSDTDTAGHPHQTFMTDVDQVHLQGEDHHHDGKAVVCDVVNIVRVRVG